jgi:hypothetical protein
VVERALQQAESIRAAKPAVAPAKIEAFSSSAREILQAAIVPSRSMPCSPSSLAWR